MLQWATTGNGAGESAERVEWAVCFADDPAAVKCCGNIGLDASTEQALCLCDVQLTAALRIDPAGDLGTWCRQRLSLARLARCHPDQVSEYRVLAADQMDRVPWLSDLSAFKTRLLRDCNWTLFREVQSSAGLHAAGWREGDSESPSLRVRRALLLPSGEGHYVLSGENQLRLQLSSDRPTQTQVTLVLPQLSYLPCLPLRVGWQVDDQPPCPVQLGQPGRLHTLNVSLAPGAHRMRLQIDQPVVNQYVLVQLHEQSSGQEQQAWSDGAGARDERRFYHVATREEPLSFRVLGPARIRIDQRTETETRTRYVNVLDGERQFQLRPPDDTDFALLRVFELQPQPWESPVAARPIVREAASRPPVWLDQLPRPTDGGWAAGEPAWMVGTAAVWGDPIGQLSLFPPDAPPTWVELSDAFALGGQEDGTWGLAASVFQRRPVDEDFQGRAPDRFAELRLLHDYRADWQDTFTTHQALFRLREESGPTLGLLYDRWWDLADDHGWMELPPGRWPFGLLEGWMLNWDLAGYLQQPADALPPGDRDTEGSLSTSLCAYCRKELTPRIWHWPSATVFGRWLSLDEVRYGPGRVDQDVFTRYKADHPTGLRLSDTWVYQPCLDRQCWLRLR